MVAGVIMVIVGVIMVIVGFLCCAWLSEIVDWVLVAFMVIIGFLWLPEIVNR